MAPKKKSNSKATVEKPLATPEAEKEQVDDNDGSQTDDDDAEAEKEQEESDAGKNMSDIDKSNLLGSSTAPPPRSARPPSQRTPTS